MLLQEEAASLSATLIAIGSCIFPLRAMLVKFKLPQATLNAARELAAATGSVEGNKSLQRALSRPSRRTWGDDVEALVSKLRLLKRAWPSEESCSRLRQREGEAHTMSPLDQKASNS